MGITFKAVNIWSHTLTSMPHHPQMLRARHASLYFRDFLISIIFQQRRLNRLWSHTDLFETAFLYFIWQSLHANRKQFPSPRRKPLWTGSPLPLTFSYRFLFTSRDITGCSNTLLLCRFRFDNSAMLGSAVKKLVHLIFVFLGWSASGNLLMIWLFVFVPGCWEATVIQKQSWLRYMCNTGSWWHQPSSTTCGAVWCLRVTEKLRSLLRT